MNGEIRAHLANFWPDRPQEDFEWRLGPIGEHIPGFRVRRVGPRLPTEPWAYVTLGAATATKDERTEFVLLAASESPRHVETLAMVASFHSHPQHRLRPGVVVNIGRPWAEGSEASHLLVSLPYPFGPEFEICSSGDGDIRILWLVPITTSESEFIRAVGLEDLEARLEQSEVDLLDPFRPSVA